MKLKKKLQEALKSKQIEIKKMRTKPKTNTKWRTKLNFSRPGTKTKTRREKQRAGEKNSIVVELSPSLEQLPFHHLHYFLAHRMRQ